MPCCFRTCRVGPRIVSPVTPVAVAGLGVGIAVEEVVDNEVHVTVVLSEVDNVVCEADDEEVVLEGMATMTEEGQTKYRITPGVGYIAGHSSTPRLSRKEAPSPVIAFSQPRRD